MRTIRAIDEAGQDIRAWCYHCARGDRIDAIIWQKFEARGWDDMLPAAASRFRCKQCRGRDVLIVPATRPRPLSDRPGYAAEQLVAGMFHFWRSQRKRGRGHGRLVRDRGQH